MAWRPPERLLPSQWAERYRRLSRSQSLPFGQWSNANAPSGVGIMDLAIRFPRIRKLAIKKAGEDGGAPDSFRCLLGFFAFEEPDPCLLILPDEKSSKNHYGKRILPLFEETEKLKGLKSQALARCGAIRHPAHQWFFASPGMERKRLVAGERPDPGLH